MRRIAVGIGSVVLVVVLVGSVGVGVGAAQGADNGTDASLGAEISSFMQASDTETANEFDDGMFAAAVNRSTDPEERRALIENRTDRLEERNQALRAQREGLGDEPDVRSHAVATRIAVGSSGLERAANRTESAARGVGADTDRISELRSSARELRGPDVVGLTPGVAGPPGESVRGPPEGVPASSENRSSEERSTTPETAANRSGGAGGNRSVSPPDEANGDERSGPPDDGDGGDSESDSSENGDDTSDGGSESGSSKNGNDRSESNSNGNDGDTGPPSGDGSEAPGRSNGDGPPDDRGSGESPN